MALEPHLRITEYIFFVTAIVIQKEGKEITLINEYEKQPEVHGPHSIPLGETLQCPITGTQDTILLAQFKLFNSP